MTSPRCGRRFRRLLRLRDRAKDDEVEHDEEWPKQRMLGNRYLGSDQHLQHPQKETTTDAASEGGTTHMETDETISKETHEALLDKAVRDATALSDC
jgi:hypothetical protein